MTGTIPIPMLGPTARVSLYAIPSILATRHHIIDLTKEQLAVKVMSACMRVCQVEKSAFLSSCRKRENVLARAIFCKVMRDFDSSITLSWLGQWLGGKDHSTIIHLIKSFEVQTECYEDIKAKYEQVTTLVMYDDSENVYAVGGYRMKEHSIELQVNTIIDTACRVCDCTRYYFYSNSCRRNVVYARRIAVYFFKQQHPQKTNSQIGVHFSRTALTISNLLNKDPDDKFWHYYERLRRILVT